MRRRHARAGAARETERVKRVGEVSRCLERLIASVVRRRARERSLEVARWTRGSKVGMTAAWYVGYKAAHHATGFLAFTSAFVSLALVAAHVRHYTLPRVQRHIVRVIMIVPVFSLMSWGSLVMSEADGIYVETVRDMYESWVVYNFLNLCLEYVGGPGAIVNAMTGKEVKAGSWLRGTCVYDRDLVVDGHYIRRCKQGCLQFVFIKPLLSVLEIVLQAKGKLGDGQINFLKAYVYILFVYNISYSLALYALWMFYLGAHDPLAKYNPLLKFIIVKSVIFFSFWQSVFTAMAVRTGTLESPLEGRAVQNVLICVEMFIVSFLMWFAFPYKDFVDPEGVKRGFVSNVVNFVSVRDVFDDTVHQFGATYQEYTLHGDGETPDRTVRMRTFVPTGRSSAPTEDERDTASLSANMAMENALFHDEERANGPVGLDRSDAPRSPGRPVELVSIEEGQRL